MAESYVIDSNLLILYVVGQVDRGLIQRHRRVRHFRIEDFERLREMIGQVGTVYVTPNTLTETSNLLNIGRGPLRERLFGRLRDLIGQSVEVVVSSEDAAQRDEFTRLGLTDSVLLEAISPQRPLLTVDVELFQAAWSVKPNSAIHFPVQALAV